MKLVAALACLSTAVFSSAPLWAADPTPLNLKPGEWEYTVTTQMTGMSQPAGEQMPQIPPDQIAKLPPEQRAKIEAAMKQAAAMAAGKPTTNTSKNCVKKEDLASLNLTNTPKFCQMTVTQSSSSRFEAKMVCESPENKTTGTMTVEAQNPESFKFKMVTSGTGNGHPMNMTADGVGKWLSSTCTETK